ncbi:MAG: helix-turn-helix domain-containing protein [Acidimicrobiales bacterium]
MSDESAQPPSEQPATPKAPSGRPRDPAIDDRVLAAARASLVEVGWDATSIRGIAERAGVSRPAIARRWPSKTHLVLEALLGAEPNMVPFEGVDLRGWIDGVVDGSFELFGREDMQSAMPGLLATLRDHDDLRAAMWDGFVGPATELAVDQGAAAAKVARAAIAVAAGAALFTSVMVGDDPALMASVRSLVSDALVSSLVEHDEHVD